MDNHIRTRSTLLLKPVSKLTAQVLQTLVRVAAAMLFKAALLLTEVAKLEHQVTTEVVRELTPL
jgi:hypothetical protein